MKIGKYEVKLKDKLGWYDLQTIKNELASGAKINEKGLSGFDGGALMVAKMKLWELSIAEIKEGDKVIPFSIDWVKGLSSDEGDELDKVIAELEEKK